MSQTSSKQITKGRILLGGSFNPVHFSHVELLCKVKDYCETRLNLKIINAYLVITTDKYVSNKLHNEAMSFIHRKNLCDIMIQSQQKYSFIQSSKKECSSALQYIEYLDKNNNNNNSNDNDEYVKNIIVMGADKILTNNNSQGKWLRYCQNENHIKCLTLCVGREGCEDSKIAYQLYLSDKKLNLINTDVFQFVNLNVDDLSSTNVRKILLQYKNLIPNKDNDIGNNNDNDNNNYNDFNNYNNYNDYKNNKKYNRNKNNFTNNNNNTNDSHDSDNKNCDNDDNNNKNQNNDNNNNNDNNENETANLKNRFIVALGNMLPLEDINYLWNHIHEIWLPFKQ